MTTVIDLPVPDDWHVHLRDDEMLAAVVGYTARRFRYAMVMPNLVPPITSTAAASSYRNRILDHAPPDTPDFQPLMTLYCSPLLDIADVRAGVQDGVIKALKYYPVGATTNSAAGGRAMDDFMDLYELLANLNVQLLVHAESTDPEIDIFDREAAFLEQQLAPLCERLPELSVTVEHVSTAAGVDFVANYPQVAASITPHHLSRERSHLLADGMRPDLYCKPVINSGKDQSALVAAATSGNPNFFLGTDSAPHPTTSKYGPKAKAGIFNAAYGLEVVADVFNQANKLDQLAAFVSYNGAKVYKVSPSGDTLRLTQQTVDAELATTFATRSGDTVVLFGAEEASRWNIERIAESPM